MSQNCGDDDYMDPKNHKFRFSNVSLGQKGGGGADVLSDAGNPKGQSNSKNFLSPQMSEVFDDNQGVVDFQDLLSTQQSGVNARQ